MFTVGMEADTRAYFTTVTMMISIPTGTKIFNWLTNVYCNFNIFLHLNTFILFFIIIFIIGGTSGIILGNSAVDLLLHDTYYVVSHFHQVLAIGSVLTILLFILVYQSVFTFINIFNHYNFTNVNLLFLYLFVNINLLFLNLMFLGFNVLPRRINDYVDFNIFWNLISSTNIIYIIFILIL